MPVELLSSTERAKLSRFPSEIPREDLRRHFTLSDEDLCATRKQRLDPNRLGFALLLSALRYLGFIPSDLTEVPRDAIQYIADQIGTGPDVQGEHWWSKVQLVRGEVLLAGWYVR